MIKKIAILCAGLLCFVGNLYAVTDGNMAKLTQDAMEILESNRCLVCHAIDGKKKVGPSYFGVYGKKIKVKEGGVEKEVLVDDRYLKDAIIEPNKEILVGYPANMMKSYKDILTPEEISTLIEYFKILK
ncbi:MAG: c-type cytochrome [Sulfurospirillaceae bacterium]|nr:c-type cytochrome [Sulfurospirillaceae bacterium]